MEKYWSVNREYICIKCCRFLGFSFEMERPNSCHGMVSLKPSQPQNPLHQMELNALNRIQRNK